MLRPVVIVAILMALAGGALAYLRDPPWLAHVESGLRGWETAADGTRFRWTDGHASLFVPSADALLVIPIRTTFNGPEDPPVLVSIAIDDRPADEFELRDDRWTSRTLRLPPPGRRTLRRIDIRVDRVRAGNRGVQLGMVETK
jgi:hypothetical protein